MKAKNDVRIPRPDPRKAGEEAAARANQTAATRAPVTGTSAQKTDEAPLEVPKKGWTDFGSVARSNEYRNYQSAMQNAGGYYKNSAAGDAKAHKAAADGLGGQDSAAATMGAQQDFVASGMMPEGYKPTGSIDAPTKAAFAKLKSGQPEFPSDTSVATRERVTRLGAAMREPPGFLPKDKMDAALKKQVPTMPQISNSTAAAGTAAPRSPKNSVEAMGGMKQIYDNLQNSLSAMPGGQASRDKLATELAQGRTVEGAIPSPEAMKVYDAMGQAQKQLNALPDDKARADLKQYMDQNLPSHVKQTLDAVKQGDAADLARNDPKNIAAAKSKNIRDGISAQMKALDETLKSAPGGMKPVLDELKAGQVGHDPRTSPTATQVRQTMDRINQQINSLPEGERDYARKDLLENQKTNRELKLTHQALTALKQGGYADGQRAEADKKEQATAAQRTASAQAQAAAVKDLTSTYGAWDKKLPDAVQKQLAGKAIWPWQQQAPASVVSEARAFSAQVNQRLNKLPAEDRAAVLETLATQFPNAGRLVGSANEGVQREEFDKNMMEAMSRSAF